MTHTLAGKYVPLGIMRFYGDTVFEKALDALFQLLQSVGIQDLMSYPKLTAAYFKFLEPLIQEHLSNGIPQDYFGFILQTLPYGLISPDAQIVSSVCTVLDTLLTAVFKNSAEDVGMIQVFRGEYIEIFKVLVQIGVVEEANAQWSLSRALWTWCCVFWEVWEYFLLALVAAQSPEYRETVTPVHLLVFSIQRLIKNGRWLQN